MTAFPIVERELRVAARRRGTFQVRFVAAAAAAFLGGLALLAESLPGARGGAGSGRNLFLLLVWVGFGLAMLAGVLLTADCLSREKREGTLGFLFLTDLSGLEVVAGKFAALSLVPLHGLLAVFPVAALTVFMGGVTGAEFGRTTLVVTNTLFVSLAAGMWVSSLVDDERQATGLTLGTLALLTGVPELAGWLAGLFPASAGFTQLRLASPAASLRHGFDILYGTAPAPFWWALLGQHALGWVFLIGAAMIVRHAWRQRGPTVPPTPTPTAAPAPARTPPPTTNRADSPRSRVGRLPSRWQRRVRQAGPIAWLAWQDTWIRRSIWWVTALVSVAALGIFAGLITGPGRAGAYDRVALLITGGFFLLKLLLAIHAVYFLQDSCRQGTMEILLTTPLSNRTLTEGHFAAMRHMVVWPVLLLGLLQTALSLVAKLVIGGDWPSIGTLVLVAVTPPLVGLLIHFADFLAVAYHASRWALHYDRPAKALLRTILLVLVLPALFCGQARFLVALFVIGQTRPLLERFRDRVQAWYFPDPLGHFFGAPRPR